MLSCICRPYTYSLSTYHSHSIVLSYYRSKNRQLVPFLLLLSKFFFLLFKWMNIKKTRSWNKTHLLALLVLLCVFLIFRTNQRVQNKNIPLKFIYHTSTYDTRRVDIPNDESETTHKAVYLGISHISTLRRRLYAKSSDCCFYFWHSSSITVERRVV